MGNLDSANQERLRLQRKNQIKLAKKKARRKRGKKVFKVFFFILVFVLTFIFYDENMELGVKLSQMKFDSINFNWIKLDKIKFDWFSKKDNKKSKDPGTYESVLAGKTIAYVPIDDRMIHTTRMKYLSESNGYTLVMPDEKYYKTNVDSGDNSYAGYSTKYGNPIKIASWLLEMEEDGCDYYIISLDQLFSGGIVGSEYLSDKDFEVYGKKIDTAKKAFEKIIKDENNHVYLIDSIMGLSVTPGFMDFTSDDYKLLVEYSKLPRKILNDEDLTISKISENYYLDQNGKSIQTTLALDKLNKYLAARERKITYSKYIIETISKSENKNNIHLYYGINDSSASSNIQEADIAYVEKLISSKKVNATVREGVSTLSEVAYTDMLLDSITKKINISISYFGDYNKTISGSTSTYQEYMNNLLKDLGIKDGSKNPNFEILVYISSDKKEDKEKNTINLINHYLDNIHKSIPTVIINDAKLSEDMLLIDYLSNYDKANIPIGYLIGYSNWNGFINSSRIGLCEGTTRFIYLAQEKHDDKNDKAFAKSMTLSFVEDMAFVPLTKTDNNIENIENNMSSRVNMILNNLKKASFISDIKPYEERGIKSASIMNYYLPWSRNNEISFGVDLSLGEGLSPVIPNSITEAKEG